MGTINKYGILTLGEEDFISLHYKKHRLFSLKTAYRLALNLTDTYMELGSSGGDVNGERRL